MAAKTNDINDKIRQLDKELEWFSSDDFSLSAAVEKYQHANRLAAEIEQDLAELENQVEVIEDFTKR